MQFQVPEGWQVTRQEGRVTVLMVGSDMSAMIFIAPGKYTSQKEILADLGKASNSLGLRGYPTEQPHITNISGKKVLAAAYQGTNQQGMALQSRFLSVYSPHQTHLNILGLATPEKYAKVKAAVEKIAATMKNKAPTINRAMMAQLRGRWTYYDGASTSSIAGSGYSSRSYQETSVFDGQGGYRWSSSSHVSVDSRITTGGHSSGASNFGENSDQGSYIIIGNTLICQGRHGMNSFDIFLQGNKLVSAGRIYLRE